MARIEDLLRVEETTTETKGSGVLSCNNGSKAVRGARAQPFSVTYAHVITIADGRASASTKEANDITESICTYRLTFRNRYIVDGPAVCPGVLISENHRD